ncbi:hypothetical protein [uncultured Bradyrhizobium sp.]|uniref:hypothetical protein n=1 Tax=uncultured Bradyrhizobium sp. TaxID=199684 RepID=UPI0035C945EC
MAAATGCGEATGSEGAARSGVAMMSEAAALIVVLPMPGFATPGVSCLIAASASTLPAVAVAAAAGPAPDCAFCEGVLVVRREADALSRGRRLSVAADVSS